ncbi:major facilitator superfamily transporter sugar, partial [Metarhizium hybridum]
MTSWYSNILTRTTSQISSLRSTLLASENDGDTEDDTHVCRVLRNYYGDKGRPLPSWLPPDPKAPPAPAAQQPLYVQPQVGARYGGLQTGGESGCCRRRGGRRLRAGQAQAEALGGGEAESRAGGGPVSAAGCQLRGQVCAGEFVWRAEWWRARRAGKGEAGLAQWSEGV